MSGGAAPAATVLLLRDGAAGLEVHMQRRRADMAVGALAWVFPGGSVDAADLGERACRLCDPAELAAVSVRLGLTGARLRDAAGLCVCTARELLEEAGVMLAVGSEGGEARGASRAPRAAAEGASRAPGAADSRVHDAGWAPGVTELRRQVLDGADFASVLLQRGLRVDLARLAYVAHFITPVGMPRRYDTRFFAVVARAEEEPAAHGGEAIEGAWCRPGEMLARAAAGEADVLPPTRILLGELGRHASAGAAAADLGSRAVATIQFDLARMGAMPLPDHLPGVDEVAALLARPVPS